MGTDPPFTHPMPLSTVTRSADATPLSEAGAAARGKDIRAFIAAREPD